MSNASPNDRPETYSAASKWLHWLIAGLVLVALPMGVILDKLPEGPLQDRLFDLHRSLGVLVLALAVLRVAARWTFGAPAPELATLAVADGAVIDSLPVLALCGLPNAADGLQWAQWGLPQWPLA